MTESWWLADQADPDLVDIWSYPAQVAWERELWTTVMRLQATLGLDIPSWAIRSSDALCDRRHITPEVVRRINDRERITRHDVKARLEVFCEQAGHEYHHLGMTSADVVDNGMQARMLDSMRWLEKQGHRLPAQDRYLLRGIKGAVGTQQDQLDLLGSEGACIRLDKWLAQELGFPGVMVAVGQVYPRSQDLEVLSELQVAVARVPGASSSPFFALLSGFGAMAAAYAGGQWNEGDVSTSVIRRYCLPGAWFAASAALKQGDR